MLYAKMLLSFEMCLNATYGRTITYRRRNVMLVSHGRVRSVSDDTPHDWRGVIVLDREKIVRRLMWLGFMFLSAIYCLRHVIL